MIIRSARTFLLGSSLALLLPGMAACSKKDDAKKETSAEPKTAPAPTPPPPAADAAEAKAPEPAPPAGPTVGACTVKEDKSCSETKLNNPGESETYGKQCADISKGTWAEGPCPMENVIGECNSAAAGRTVYYKGAKDAKHTCEQMVMGGVYTAAAK